MHRNTQTIRALLAVLILLVIVPATKAQNGLFSGYDALGQYAVGFRIRRTFDNAANLWKRVFLVIGHQYHTDCIAGGKFLDGGYLEDGMLVATTQCAHRLVSLLYQKQAYALAAEMFRLIPIRPQAANNVSSDEAPNVSSDEAPNVSSDEAPNVPWKPPNATQPPATSMSGSSLVGSIQISLPWLLVLALLLYKRSHSDTATQTEDSSVAVDTQTEDSSVAVDTQTEDTTVTEDTQTEDSSVAVDTQTRDSSVAVVGRNEGDTLYVSSEQQFHNTAAAEQDTGTVLTYAIPLSVCTLPPWFFFSNTELRNRGHCVFVGQLYKEPKPEVLSAVLRVLFPEWAYGVDVDTQCHTSQDWRGKGSAYVWTSTLEQQAQLLAVNKEVQIDVDASGENKQLLVTEKVLNLLPHLRLWCYPFAQDTEKAWQSLAQPRVEWPFPSSPMTVEPRRRPKKKPSHRTNNAASATHCQFKRNEPYSMTNVRHLCRTYPRSVDRPEESPPPNSF